MSPNLHATFLKNLRIAVPDAKALRCPVCEREEPQVTMTEGHIYPSLVSAPGGKVPECSDCNGTLGAFCESDVVHFVRYLLFGYNELPPAEFRHLRMGSGTVDGQPARLVKPESKGPALAFRIQGPSQEPIRLPDGRVHMSGSFSGPTHANGVVAGLVHSAYLKLYRFFGYEYVSDVGADYVRNSLKAAIRAAPDKEKQRHGFSEYFRFIRLNVHLPKEPNVPYVYRGDDGLCGFLAFMPVVHKVGTAILLPGFGASSVEAYRAAASRPVLIKGTTAPVPWASYRESYLTGRQGPSGSAFYERTTSPAYPGIPVNFGVVDDSLKLRIDNRLI